MKIQLITSKVLFFLVFLITSSRVSAQEILYGLTQNGGLYEKGVIYQINADGSNYVVYGDFNGENGAHPGNGAGLTQVNGNDPFAGFAALTMQGGGSLDRGARAGVVAGRSGLLPPFKFQFGENETGTHPWGSFLLGPNNYLFGMTSDAGHYNGGAIFSSRAPVSNGVSSSIHFDGINRGKSPKGSLIQGADGLMYGMTELGGKAGKGVIFAYRFSNNSFEKLHDFDGTLSGANPTGSLVLAADGRLYGMTKRGGSFDLGVVFSINIDGTDFIKLIDLGSSLGSLPQGSLVEYSDGKLYGMTSAGGVNGFGTIFSITLSGEFTKLVDFDGANGKSPVGDLVMSINGDVLYGATFYGGKHDKGVIFRLENGRTFSKFHDFEEKTGANPVGALAVRKAMPDLSFPEFETKTTTSDAFDPQVETSTGMPTYLISMDESVAIIEDNKIKTVGEGYTDIIAYIIGDYQYIPHSITRKLYVEKTEQTVDFPTIPDMTFGDEPYQLRATSSSGLPVQFIGADEDEFVIRNAGTFTVRAYQQGDEIYSPAEASRTFVVHPAEQSIEFQLGEEVICCEPINLKATASSGLPVSFKTLDWEKISINNNTATIFELGKAEVIAYSEGNKNYKPTEKKVSINIVMGTQTIDFDLPNKTFQYGGPDQYVFSKSTSELPITYTSDPPGIAVYDGRYLRLIGVGTTTITASQEGNELMQTADPVSQTITVNPADEPGVDNSIIWEPIFSKMTMNPPFNLYAKTSTGLPVSYSSSDTSVAVVSGNLVRIKGGGVTTITAEQRGNDTIPAATPVQYELQVNKMYQSIPNLHLYNVKYGEIAKPLASRTSGGLPISYSSSNPSVAYVDEDYFLHYVNSGAVTISAVQEGNENYLPANPRTDRFSISPLYQTISFDSIPSKTFGDDPFELTAEATSGYDIAFFSDSTEIATVEGRTVTIHQAGTTLIKAMQVGSPGYNHAEKEMPLVVKKATQNISFDPLPEMTFSDDPFEVSATSSVGLPVLFKSSNTAVAQIDGNKVNVVGAGTADIIAYQPGNDNYKAAEVSQELKVKDSGKDFGMFGITYSGGMNSGGTVFGMQSDGANYKILKDFASFTPGFPEGGLIKGSDGRLYGAFSASGSKGRGALVRFEEDGSGMKELYAFDIATGWDLNGGLIQGSDGAIYGTTRKGGTYNLGTIYKVSIDGTSHKVLRDLSDLDGTLPNGGLLEATDGKLYGMTSSQGFYGSGTIFSVKKDGTEFEVIFRFTSSEPYKTGDSPRGQLIEGDDGYLYGVMYRRGRYGKGVLFKIQKNGSNHTKLIEFDGVNYGGYPGGTLLIGSDGKIYGTTQSGGENDLGTLYSVNTDGSNFTRLFSFDGAFTGSEPQCQLTEASDGLLYGLTKAGGASSRGTVFSINRDGNNFKKLADLEATLSSGSNGPLLEVTPGEFIGVTTFGGSSYLGTVFSVNSDSQYKLIKEFPREVGVAPLSFISDNSGDFYYGLTLGGSPSGNGCIFRISEDGDFLQFDLPFEVFPSKIFYVSTGHIWVSGTRDGKDVVFRIKGDGTEYETLTEVVENIPSKIEWLTDTYDGDVIGITVRSDGPGIIFKVKNDGTGYTKIGDMPSGIEFVKSSYVYASDGNIYAISGYSHDFYKIKTNGVVEHLAKLPNEIGQVPMKLIEMNGGNIGALMSSSGIISVGKDGKGYKKIFDKPAGTSVEDMVQSFDGWIFVAERKGTMNENGLIYKVRSDGSSFTPVHQFDIRDGQEPTALLFKKMPQQFVFDPIPVKDVLTQSFRPTTYTSSGARSQFTSSDSSVAVVEYGFVKPVGSGKTTITASLPPNANYFPVAELKRELVVEKVNQELTIENPGDRNLEDLPILLVGTSSSGLPIAYRSSSPSIDIVDSIVTILKPGIAEIEAYQEGDRRYNPAESVFFSFCIKPSLPSISLLSYKQDIILSSSSDDGNQWYFNNKVLVGENGKTLKANEIGTYTVMTTVDGCSSAMSEPFNTVVTGVENGENEFYIRVYPNPAENEISVEVNGLSDKGTIELIDPLGRTIKFKELNGAGKYLLDISNSVQGLHVVKVVSGRNVLVEKVLKR
ncbi:hypothetical protein GCM10028791_15500 [Echinicola sediminis]